MAGWNRRVSPDRGPSQVKRLAICRKHSDLAVAGKQVDLLDGSKTGTKSLARAILKNAVPTIFVSTQPAELLQTQGDPQAAPIEGTELIYVINTENDIFVHTPSQDHYIYFRAAGSRRNR